MNEILKFGEYTIARKELKSCQYKCDPALCTGHVCCAVFDIAITISERDRISTLLPELEEYCPWMRGNPEFFKITPCEIFIRKRGNGLCIFNWEDTEGRAWCAIHTLALKKGLNPFKLKPLNCSMWPFLRDGGNQLELDRDTPAPCLKFHAERPEDDPELRLMLEDIAAPEESTQNHTESKPEDDI